MAATNQPRPLPDDFFFSFLEAAVEGRPPLPPNQVRWAGLAAAAVLPCREYRSSVTSMRSDPLFFFLPPPKMPATTCHSPLAMQQKQSSRSRTTPAMVPTTIPAMAPPLSELPAVETAAGLVLEDVSVALANVPVGEVWVADGPLVGRYGAENWVVT